MKFSSWNIALWTKRAHQSTNFQIFECFNESSLNSSCHFWNHKVKVYSNLASLFTIMRDNSSVFFKLKMYMIWTKGAHQSAKFQTFDCSHKISPTLYFDRLLLLKVQKDIAVHSSHVMTLKIVVKFEKKLICCFKNDKHSKVSKICTFIGFIDSNTLKI